MSQSAFDRSFGADFLEDVPRAPGVYRFWSDREEVVYVGKAVDLRARLGQYRNTRRIKAHRKRRKVIKAASRLTFEVTETELDALLLEIELIQELQPRLNTAGAYFFLYPTLGFKREGRYLHLAHSTKVEGLREQGFQVFGVYRRREITRAGFDALVELMSGLGHVEGAPERLDYTSWRRFRQIPEELDGPLEAFLLGKPNDFLERLILALVERPGARHEASRMQACIEALEEFSATECHKLGQLLEREGVTYLTQRQRDPASIRAGFALE